MTERRSPTAAETIAANLTIGDVIDYEEAEEMGEQVVRELKTALWQHVLTLVDDGDGHEVRHESWQAHAAEHSHLAARHWNLD